MTVIENESTPARNTPAGIRLNRTLRDRQATLATSGYFALLGGIALIAIAIVTAYGSFFVDRNGYNQVAAGGLGWALAEFVLAILCFASIYSLQPNESAVLTLFGSYVGTDSTPGLRMTVPLFGATKVSQRVRYHECATLKVNDLIGNPIEIGAVVVWHVSDCAKAIFQINDFVRFVGAQTESALRHIAGRHPYDFNEMQDARPDEAKGGEAGEPRPTKADGSRHAAGTLSLRESGEEVIGGLVRELRERLSVAGVEIDEARITHLAYAPEIAPVMLRRQQASAIIAARKQVVTGAVEIVSDALTQLKAKTEIDLDGERKAAMVSNLLVVLVSDKDATPVVNAGTLYG